MGEEEESDEDENSSARNGKGVELLTNEYASRHEENRTTATTKDHNMKRKLEVRPSFDHHSHSSLFSLFRL